MKIIFTAIIGNYDRLNEPVVYTPGWEYICFTDTPDLVSEVWTIVDISDYPALQGLDDIRKARYIKINFHKFIKAEYSIWHDASMWIMCNLDEFWSNYYHNQFTILQHPDRDCAYNEVTACMRLRKDSNEVMTKQMNFYWKQGFPMNIGLAASGIILRKRNKHTIEFCENWFDEIRRHSTRDQLSFNYTAWYNEFNFSYIPFYTIFSHFMLNKHNARPITQDKVEG